MGLEGFVIRVVSENDRSEPISNDFRHEQFSHLCFNSILNKTWRSMRPSFPAVVDLGGLREVSGCFLFSFFLLFFFCFFFLSITFSGAPVRI